MKQTGLLALILLVLWGATPGLSQAGESRLFAVFAEECEQTAQVYAQTLRERLPGLDAKVYAERTGPEIVYGLYVRHPEMSFDDVCRQLGAVSCPSMRQKPES